jgi:hypothetical protein
MSEAPISHDEQMEALILHVYPWWEMQRVRELSLRAKATDQRLSNVWQHAPGLVDHNYRGITTPNCDTLYSGAWLDLDAGPILIEVPATELPYWSIAVMDLNTDNIAIIGSRYPGSGSLLVCGQSYQGLIPDGMPHVRSASRVVWLLARYLIGSDELAAQADAMRRSVRLRRLQDDAGVMANAACPLSVPLVAAVRKDPKNFWQVIRTTLDEDSALPELIKSPIRREIQAVWPPGVTEWSGLDSGLQRRFVDAFNHVLQRITANNSGNMQTRGQWRYPGKDIGNFGENSLYRAEVSLWGLGALPTKEVIYVSAVADEQGAFLDGNHNYKFRIPPEGIPAEAFWSLTMYEVDPFGGMYLTANSMKRYAVGDRTPGLQKNADGSIDIWITHKQPIDLNRLENWLPAPICVFRLMIRAYAPSELFQSGEILPPAVERLC